MNRAPVTIAKWSTCASTWTWTVWPLLKRYVRPRAVYTYPCICLTLTYQPLFLRISRPDGKKARERERERERGRRREEDLYVQWQPVIPVAATGSAPRYISLSRSLPRRVLSTKSGAKLYQILAALTRLARFCLVWYTCETKEGYTNCCIYPFLYAFRSCISAVYIRRLLEKSHFFTRQGTLHRWKQVSGRDGILIRVSRYVGFDGVGRFLFSFFFFFSLFESWCCSFAFVGNKRLENFRSRGGEQFPVGRFLQIFRRGWNEGSVLLSVFVCIIGHCGHSATTNRKPNFFNSIIFDLSIVTE